MSNHCVIMRDGNVKLRVDKILERLLTTEALLVVATDSNGMETAEDELELLLAAETEGPLSSLSAIVDNVDNCLGNHVFTFVGKCAINVGICRNL